MRATEYCIEKVNETKHENTPHTKKTKHYMKNSEMYAFIVVPHELKKNIVKMTNKISFNTFLIKESEIIFYFVFQFNRICFFI